MVCVVVPVLVAGNMQLLTVQQMGNAVEVLHKETHLVVVLVCEEHLVVVPEYECQGLLARLNYRREENWEYDLMHP